MNVKYSQFKLTTLGDAMCAHTEWLCAQKESFFGYLLGKFYGFGYFFIILGHIQKRSSRRLSWFARGWIACSMIPFLLIFDIFGWDFTHFYEKFTFCANVRKV